MECMALITITSVSLPALLPTVLVGRNQLRHACKRSGACRNLVAQSYQQIPRLDRGAAVTDRDRRFAVAGEDVRHEAAFAKGPQEFVQAFGIRLSIGVDMNGVLQASGLFGESAGEHVTSVFVDAVENVKVDLSHVVCQGRAPARDEPENPPAVWPPNPWKAPPPRPGRNGLGLRSVGLSRNRSPSPEIICPRPGGII